ncbi:hypothetical protein AXF42_Ash002163 [Apostasia shenzhenica]|uniref:Uncharacterized protein n=1 Tax=Apostasia shenzhenica TaxID=1088818 RepID=A0A2I0AMR8_9ASPA|nr:hypothetical protein AXF42_Ash002163 [Apostasia shenzhenica]
MLGRGAALVSVAVNSRDAALYSCEAAAYSRKATTYSREHHSAICIFFLRRYRERASDLSEAGGDRTLKLQKGRCSLAMPA